MKFRSKARNRGFTLIEMVVVISLILILLSIALPMYNQSIIRARESTLRQNLATLNKCIDQYTLDKQKAPQSLQDLVSAGYLRSIPKDPLTGSTDTWQTTSDDTIMDPNQSQPGITDVHSGASGVSTEGTAYASW